MTAKFERLRASAIRSAANRKHNLSVFRTTARDGRGQPIRATATCGACKAYVQIDTAPAPNGIDIGGDAVAIDCRGFQPTV